MAVYNGLDAGFNFSQKQFFKKIEKILGQFFVFSAKNVFVSLPVQVPRIGCLIYVRLFRLFCGFDRVVCLFEFSYCVKMRKQVMIVSGATNGHCK